MNRIWTIWVNEWYRPTANENKTMWLTNMTECAWNKCLTTPTCLRYNRLSFTQYDVNPSFLMMNIFHRHFFCTNYGENSYRVLFSITTTQYAAYYLGISPALFLKSNKFGLYSLGCFHAPTAAGYWLAFMGLTVPLEVDKLHLGFLM